MENKNPNEQLGGVVNAWADMQKRMWGDWSSLLQNLPGGSEGPVEAAKKGVAAASKGTNEAARMLMDRMTSSQGAMNRVMDLSLIHVEMYIRDSIRLDGSIRMAPK